MLMLLLLVLAALAQEAVTASLVLKVPRPEETADLLVAEAEKAGGYFSSRADQSVQLKVPTAAADAFLAFAEQQGIVADRSFQRISLQQSLTELTARLDAREQMLARYFEVLDDASAGSVVSVEREIVRLVAEIEGLQGQLRVLHHRAQYADIGVSFQFRDRAAPARDGSSSFAWLNTLNVADLVEDFHGGDRPRGGKCAGKHAIPDGFAPYRKVRREVRAVSPDDVLYRVRAEKHKPQAELAFWEEALKKRMTDAGYTVVETRRIAGAEGGGTLLIANAPLGNADYTYLIAAFPQGRKLTIYEAAGEIATFAPRQAAILGAIEGEGTAGE